jgi:3-oxoacyl-[acyl-carrier protein] reductase
MDLGIKGKWALVGGASKGLGWGCARALALEGVNVVMVARGADVLNQAIADLQKEAPGVKLAEPLYLQCLVALAKTLTSW